jgi:hypothetical protein
MLGKMGTVLAIGYKNVQGCFRHFRETFCVLSDFLDIVLSVYKLIYTVWFFHLVLSVLHIERLSEGSFSIAIIWKVLSWVLSTWDNLPSVYVVFIVERNSIFVFCHSESRFFFPAVFFTSYRPAIFKSADSLCQFAHLPRIFLSREQKVCHY